METLTDVQKDIAAILVDWALAHKEGDPEGQIIEEGEVAKQLGEASWHRAHAEDLNILCAYCDRKDYPMVPLLVVIPGLNKPERSIYTHAFKATLSNAENTKRWREALKDIQATDQAVWDEFKADVAPEPEPEEKPKAKKAAGTATKSSKQKAAKKTGTKLGKNPLNAQRA